MSLRGLGKGLPLWPSSAPTNAAGVRVADPIAPSHVVGEKGPRVAFMIELFSEVVKLESGGRPRRPCDNSLPPCRHRPRWAKARPRDYTRFRIEGDQRIEEGVGKAAGDQCVRRGKLYKSPRINWSPSGWRTSRQGSPLSFPERCTGCCLKRIGEPGVNRVRYPIG